MFELFYATKAEIPAEVLHLYREKDGKWHLIASGDIQTKENVNRLEESLRKERNDHKETKGKLAKFGDLDSEDVLAKLDRYDELEAASKDKLDDDKIDELVEKRIKTRTAPLERKLAQLETDNAEKDKALSEHTEKDRKRTIHDHIRTAATDAKVRDTALEDALLIGERVFEVDESGSVVTRDGVGVTPGVAPDVWLTEVKEKRPHWWPDSQGGGSRPGAGGHGGSNPFSHDGWNMTEQGKLVASDRTKADALAKSAGTTVGGSKPAKKD